MKKALIFQGFFHLCEYYSTISFIGSSEFAFGYQLILEYVSFLADNVITIISQTSMSQVFTLDESA